MTDNENNHDTYETHPRWLRLDNAAKIYPAARRRNWNNVFRLSATLNETVDPDVLQSALDVTIKRFPSIAMRMRTGAFWYYLEAIDTPPSVLPDGPCPCVRMRIADIRRCAFRVKYHENRIAVEFFHILTDGNGGLIFLKTLVAEYIFQRYGVIIPSESGVLDRTDIPSSAELEDSFLRYDGEVSNSRRESNSYKLTGTQERDGFINVISGILSTSAMVAEAKRYGVTLTAYLASALIYVIAAEQSRKITNMRRRKPVKILIPVNLRPFFGSGTLRNFVLYITPGIDPATGDFSFEEILKTMHHQMGIELTDKRLRTRITANVKAERSTFVKIMPLFVKNAAMKLAYRMIGERKACLTLSNLGAARLPEGMSDFINRMDFFLGPQATRPENCAVISCGDKLVINFTRTCREANLERDFFTFLRGQGLHVTVESNQRL